MRVLLDTQALIWSSIDSPQLSAPARGTLTDTRTTGVCSLASLWEISIKVGLGKLDLTVPLAEFIGEVRARFDLLRVETQHCLRHAALPLHHRDPFDRMLIAQALSEELTIVGNDEAFDAYGVARIW